MNKLIILEKSGFSLVEVLIALAVLGIFIFPISGMFTVAIRTSEASRISIEAYSVANKVIEAMQDDDGISPVEGEPLGVGEYASYGIKNDYEVTKTIRISENQAMESFVDFESLNQNGTLLTIDASADGQLVFTNAMLQEMGYSPAFEPDFADVTISFDDSSVISGSTIIASNNFDYIRIIGGSSRLKLVLENASKTDKTLYVFNSGEGGSFSVDTALKSTGKWISYDNFSSLEKNETGSVAIADITVKVRHKATNKEFEVNTKRVFYKYGN